MNRKLDCAGSHQPKRYEEEEGEGSSSEEEEKKRGKEEKRDDSNEKPEVNSLATHQKHFKAMHPITSCHQLHRIFHQTLG